jgi:DNA mismatch repair protein MutS2
MAEKQTIESFQRELKAEQDEYAKRNAELSTELQRLKAEERQAIREARDAIVKETAELHREIRQAAMEIRREKSKQSIEQARSTLASVRKKLESEAWQPKAEDATQIDESIKVGDTVRVKEVGLTATVLSISEDSREVEVQSGRSKMKLSLDSVAKIKPIDIVSPVIQPAARRVPMEFDLRGKRADEVEPALDRYLNDAAQSNLSEVRIIHGIGTGTVRNIVREFLARHPLVKSFRAGERHEGGDGSTVVRL